MPSLPEVDLDVFNTHISAGLVKVSSASQAKLDLTVDYNSLVIWLDHLPHIAFRLDQFVGFQSWTNTSKSCIELFFKNDTPSMVVDYRSKALWKAVLLLL